MNRSLEVHKEEKTREDDPKVIINITYKNDIGCPKIKGMRGEGVVRK